MILVHQRFPIHDPDHKTVEIAVPHAPSVHARDQKITLLPGAGGGFFSRRVVDLHRDGMLPGGLHRVMHRRIVPLQRVYNRKILNMFLRIRDQTHRPLQPCVVEKIKIRSGHLLPIAQHPRLPAGDVCHIQLIVDQNGHLVKGVIAHQLRHHRQKRQETALMGRRFLPIHIHSCPVGGAPEAEGDLPAFPFPRHEHIRFIPHIPGKFPHVLIRIEILKAGRDRDQVRLRQAVGPALLPALLLSVCLKSPHPIHADRPPRGRIPRV